MKLPFKKFQNAFILSRRQRNLILMVFWLAAYRNLLLAVKSKKAFSEHICKKQERNRDLTVEKIAIAKDIALAIYIVNKYLPWKNVCRHQSWQAIFLLLKYQIPFEYFVGIEKNKPKNEGHSWVKVKDKFICGRCNISNHQIIFQK